MNKQELLKKLEELSIKADHYSRTDWDSYLQIQEQLKDLDMKLLDVYHQENESFLQSHKLA